MPIVAHNSKRLMILVQIIFEIIYPFKVFPITSFDHTNSFKADSITEEQILQGAFFSSAFTPLKVDIFFSFAYPIEL